MSSADLFEWDPVDGVKIDGDDASYSTTLQEGGKSIYFRLVTDEFAR